MKNSLFIVVFCILSISVSAQFSSYAYYRVLKPVNESGYYKIKIGSSIIDRPGHYRVFEFGQKDTLEVPYVIEEYDNSTYDKSFFKYLTIIDKSYKENKASYATLVLDTGIVYSALFLNYSAAEFFKNVMIEGSDDNKTWKTIIENEKVFHYFRAPNDHYYRNKISFEPVSFKYIRVTSDDSDSPKLDIASAYLPLIEEVSNGDGELLPTGLLRTEDKENKQTIIECSFKRMYFIGCLQLKIENDLPFRRDVEVEFLTQNTSKDKWVIFGKSTISSYSSNKIYFKNYASRDANFKTIKMRVTINNLDDRPLGNVSINAFTHEEILKCRLEKDKVYALTYGKDNDAAPQYDLEHFKNVIPLNVKKIECESEMQIVHTPTVVKNPLFGSKFWIWGALIAGVLVIGLFTLRLLKQQ